MTDESRKPRQRKRGGIAGHVPAERSVIFSGIRTHRRSDFHYNIQIHLPVTTDITVYNAIFKSLKENLGI